MYRRHRSWPDRTVQTQAPAGDDVGGETRGTRAMHSKPVAFRRQTSLRTAVNWAGVAFACAFIVAALFCGAPARAQMLSEGPNSPGAVFDDVAFGTVGWTTPGNAAMSDDMYAQATPGGGFTHYLHADNYNFSIPAPAKILGIEVNIERHSLSGTIKDAQLHLVKAGVVGATDRADTVATWPPVDTVKTYGGTS